MAMTMTGEVQLPASRQVVWEKLNDPEVLKAYIPGCEELTKSGDNQFEAVAKMKVGPVSARFKGKVTLSDFDPPNSYKISGEGEGGVAGFAKGGAAVALADKDGGTLLTYNVEAQIGGKLFAFGPRDTFVVPSWVTLRLQTNDEVSNTIGRTANGAWWTSAQRSSCVAGSKLQ